MLSKLIQALQIFLKYGDPRRPTHCEHDVMLVCIDPDKVSDEDKKILSDLGFDPVEEGFTSYRYGSA